MSERSTRESMKKQKVKEEKARKKRERARAKADRAYERKLAKEGRTTKSRKTEQDKYREVERKLNWAIGITGFLLIVVLLMVFFL